MPADWTNFCDELQDAFLAVLDADAELGTGGTYAVETREALPAADASGEIIVRPDALPYVGVAAIVGPLEQRGHLTHARVRLVVGCIYPATTSREDARLQVSGMAARAQKLIRDWHGTPPGASGHVVLVEETDVDGPTTDEDDGSASAVVTAVVSALYFETE